MTPACYRVCIKELTKSSIRTIKKTKKPKGKYVPVLIFEIKWQRAQVQAVFLPNSIFICLNKRLFSCSIPHLVSRSLNLHYHFQVQWILMDAIAKWGCQRQQNQLWLCYGVIWKQQGCASFTTLPGDGTTTTRWSSTKNNNILISHLKVGMQAAGYSTLQALPTWLVFFLVIGIFIFCENWVLSPFSIAQVFSSRSIINFKAANV